MSYLQSRSIICSITSNSNHLILFLQSFNQSFLIHRSCTRDNLQIQDSLIQFLVRKFSKFRSCNDILIVILCSPQTYLTADFLSCTRSITSDNLHIDSCIHTFSNGGRNILTNRITDSHNTHKGQIISHDLTILEYVSLTIKHLISEAESTHSLVLIFNQLILNIGFRNIILDILAQATYDFRCTLDIENCLAFKQGRLNNCSHILTLRRERQLLQNLSRLTQIQIINASLLEPKKQSTLRRITQDFHSLYI